MTDTEWNFIGVIIFGVIGLYALIGLIWWMCTEFDWFLPILIWLVSLVILGVAIYGVTR